MSVKPQNLSDLTFYWDQLTPVQQQFMIHRAKHLAAYNKLNSSKRKAEPALQHTDNKSGK